MLLSIPAMDKLARSESPNSEPYKIFEKNFGYVRRLYELVAIQPNDTIVKYDVVEKLKELKERAPTLVIAGLSSELAHLQAALEKFQGFL